MLETLQKQGYFVQSGIACDPGNQALLALGETFGGISLQGSHSGAPNLEANGVNAVQAMDTPMRDAVGNEVFSTNADLFPLHTDDSFSANPARYVLMHCWQADPTGGGISWISDLQDILRHAPPQLIDRLLNVSYPTPFGQACVLERRVPSVASMTSWKLRFNARDMQSFAKLRGQTLTTQQVQDLLAFEALAMQCIQSITLKRCDCIIVDNHRVLHGRSAFNPACGRLLKRLRVI